VLKLQGHKLEKCHSFHPLTLGWKKKGEKFRW
jgi:hypothetical protein